MSKILLVFLFFIVMPILKGQDNTKPELKFNGYIKTDLFYDSRQTVNLREGHFSLFPKDIQRDSLGKDLNDLNNFNILSIQTRLNCSISGLTAFGAKTSGFIETEFFGNSDPDINGLRLRHAFVKLSWSKTAVLIGQYWHPMFITEIMPEVLSFNTGVPFQPFSRNPQVRLSQSFGKFTFIAAASMDRDFTGLGPQGATSNYVRNSAFPGLDFQLHYNSDGNYFVAGTSFKKILPRTSTDKNFQTTNELNSYSYISAMKLNISGFTFKAEGSLVENGSSLMMLGGFGVKSKDPFTGIEEYSNLRIASVWSELAYGTDLKAGLFFGYSKNLGSTESISGPVYSRENTIDKLFRVSPRISVKSNELQIGTELEYTSVYYGKVNSKGMVEDSHQVSNLRVLLTAQYFINF